MSSNQVQPKVKKKNNVKTFNMKETLKMFINRVENWKNVLKLKEKVNLKDELIKNINLILFLKEK